MQPERIPRSLAAAPPGVSQTVWTLLLAGLALSAGLATWRVRSMEIRRAPVAAAVPVRELADSFARAPVEMPRTMRRPMVEPAPARSGESLATVRARVASSDGRTPAGDVDEWTLRLASSPGHREETRRALERMRHLEPVIRAALARERIPRDLLARHRARLRAGGGPLGGRAA